MSQKQVVVIGGGHNGLVAAWYLANAGHKVTVLESRDQVGGAAFTDTTTFPGYKISKFSYLNSLMLPEIVRDLELKRFGYEVLRRNPSSFTPVPGSAKSLLLGPDMTFNQAQIAQFSECDAAIYPRYEQELGELGEWMAQMMTMIPPSGPWPRSWRDVKALRELVRHIRRLNYAQMWRLKKLLLTDPVKYLDKKYGGWFESDVLRATLITDALIGATKLSGYVLLHHVMGAASGTRGIWGYSPGGMGGISNAIAGACKELGVEIVLGVEAQRIILVNGNRVAVVVAKTMGTDSSMPMLRLFPADIVVSAVNPSITFGKLLASERCVDHWRKKVLARDSESATMKINLTLSGLPDFYAMPGTAPGPQHQGTTHIAPSVEYILAALRDYKEGRSSSRPILEITVPSVIDDTLAPKGCHVMGIFLQFVDWQVDKEKYFRDVVKPLMREYISNIDEIITGVQILAPRDIERELGMIGGNISNGAMGFPEGLFCNRPAPGIADYRVPEIDGLYLSGAGTHPGGGVCGAPGYNTAHAILKDRRAQVI